MKRWCFPHDWSKWKTYRWTGTVYATAGYLIPGGMTVTETRQTRVCLKCGKELHRKIPEASGSTFETCTETK